MWGFESVLVMVEVLSCEMSGGVWIVSIALDSFFESGKCGSVVCEIVWNEYWSVVIALVVCDVVWYAWNSACAGVENVCGETEGWCAC